MKNQYTQTARRVENALRHVDETKHVVIGEDNLDAIVPMFKQHYPTQRAFLVADEITYKIVGETIEKIFNTAPNTRVESNIIFKVDSTYHADQSRVQEIVDNVKDTDLILIAVGSGTINDITKLAAHETRRRYFSVATAASMDGYTSYGASIEIDAFKQSRFCPAPLGVLVDMNIITNAPAAMNAAGYADLLAKIPAGADWMLADVISSEPIDNVAWDIVQPELRNWLANPAGVVSRDKTALLHLIEGLLMSGIAMQKAKSSRTASGAEHLFSHLWDNEHHTYNDVVPSHGFKVGIGTLVASALYEKFLAMSRNEFKAAHRSVPETFRNWETIKAEIRKEFGNGELAEQVLRESKAKYVEPDEVERRYEVLLANWETFRERIAKQVIPTAKIKEMLKTIEAPDTPTKIGIDRDRLIKSCSRAQLIRSRYNIIDFTREQGLWKTWIPDVIENGGFW